MNYYVILVFGKGIEIPVNLDKKYVNNGHGLFNQLFQVVNTMVPDYNSMVNITNPNDTTYIDVFSTDPFKGEVVPISDILDLEKMNQLYGYNFTDAIYTPHNIKQLNYFVPHAVDRVYKFFPTEFGVAVRKIIFSDKINSIGKKLVIEKGLEKKEVNLAHLRFCSNLSQDVKDLNIEKGCPYDFSQEDTIYLQTLESCRVAIYQNCSREIPLFLLVPNKSHPFVKELSQDYEVILLEESDYQSYLDGKMLGRDVYGLCDVSFSKHLTINNLILQESTSTFALFISHYLDFKNKISY